MKHRQNALAAIRSHGGMTRNDGGDCVVFELGNKRFMLEDRDGPSVSEFSDSIHRLVGFAPQRTASDARREQVADASLWLWLNRDAASEQWLRDASANGANIVNIAKNAKDHDERFAIINLDATAWDQIKEAASQSAWMPPEYMMNEWVADVCAFLRNPPASPWRTDTPPYDVPLLAETIDGKKFAAFYVEQGIVSAKPHGLWFNQGERPLFNVKRWMVIPQ